MTAGSGQGNTENGRGVFFWIQTFGFIDRAGPVIFEVISFFFCFFFGNLVFLCLSPDASVC